MSFFREQLERDMNDVFLNLDEFGEEVEIDGIIRRAVIDESMSGFRTATRNNLENVAGLGLVEGSVKIWLEDNFEERPVPGQILVINGEKWIINDDPSSVRVEMGMLVLSISREWD